MGGGGGLYGNAACIRDGGGLSGTAACIMGWLCYIAACIVVGLIEVAAMYIFVFVLLSIEDNGVGPAPEAPAHLSMFARAAYYTSHQRFREFFFPFLAGTLVLEGLEVLGGNRSRPPDRLWGYYGLWLVLLIWLASLAMMRLEISTYRNQPWVSAAG